MINLLVDEAYAFHYLSILEVKYSNLKEEKYKKNFELCYKQLENEINWSLFSEIIESKEYSDLFDINNKVFHAVEKAKQDQILASEVDKLNYERYVCKMELQKKWFINKELFEKK